MVGQHPGYFKAVFFNTCLHFDQAGFQKHLLTSCFFSFWATFNSNISKAINTDP
jgi:hypothetical protein